MKTAIDTLVQRLRDAGDGDLEASLRIAAATILDLSMNVSYGLTRTVPYQKVRDAKPMSPAIESPASRVAK